MTPAGARLEAVVLAAGRSSRMGGPNKLLALFDGEPLIRRVVCRVLGAGLAGAVVVTGHQDRAVGAALAGLPVRLVHNPGHDAGLSTSLRAGIAALDPAAAGALVVLSDMPSVTVADMGRLVAAFRPGAVVRATHGGRPGNPVILPRDLFSAVETLQGDSGARRLIETAGLPVIDVEIGAAAGLDVDTRAALERAGGTVVE